MIRKSVCMACDRKLGSEIAHALAEFGITYVRRFRQLRAMRIGTARLLRTGGNAAINYDAAITGVPPTTLSRQRRTAAAIQALVTGCCGQDIDLALITADGSDKGQADPAFGAHIVPIGTWATAIWERWLAVSVLHVGITDAKCKAVKAPRHWGVAIGPAAAYVLTATRLDWEVHSATEVTTDDGTRLQLHIDSPAVVKIVCHAAVQRWWWRNVQWKFPTLALGNLGVGAEMQGIWQLLRSKEETERWNHHFRGAWKSAFAGRQYPQSRCFVAGFASHDRRLVCLYDLMGKEGPTLASTCPQTASC